MIVHVKDYQFRDPNTKADWYRPAVSREPVPGGRVGLDSYFACFLSKKKLF